MTANLTLDHIVIAAETLAAGVDFVETKLGLTMAPGGKHPAMGTHNRLLSLGEVYLEVIAIDPDAAAPDRPRWFSLDAFKGPPRMTNWVARTDDLTRALALAPPGTGTPTSLSRGNFSWTFAVPETGNLPFDNAFPALILWHGQAHPTQSLPASNCRIAALQVSTTAPQDLRSALARIGGTLDQHVIHGTETRFGLSISTSTGVVTLQ